MTLADEDAYSILVADVDEVVNDVDVDDVIYPSIMCCAI